MTGFDAARLFATEVPKTEQNLTRRDTILYALSLGAGQDPTRTLALEHCLEDRLRALPTQPVVMGYPGFWLKDTAAESGLDWRRVLHGEQRLRLHGAVPVEGRITGRTTITGLIDRGDKGAALYSRREIRGDSNQVFAEVSQTTILRGHGGFGGDLGEPDAPLLQVPDRPPDMVVHRAIRPEAALIYRLNGDLNPLHADPEVARSVGFEKPILHGLCTFGVVGLALVEGPCSGEGTRLSGMAARFSAPVFPGDSLRVDIWNAGSENLSFRAVAEASGSVVLSHGHATVRP